MSKIILNGQETELAEDLALLSFLQSRQVKPENLIVEWNGKILTGKDPLETFKLQDGDTLNLFSMVGGG